jgi:hypothetical protein
VLCVCWGMGGDVPWTLHPSTCLREGGDGCRGGGASGFIPSSSGRITVVAAEANGNADDVVPVALPAAADDGRCRGEENWVAEKIEQIPSLVSIKKGASAFSSSARAMRYSCGLHLQDKRVSYPRATAA